jgi:hypothetical protein
MISHMRPPRERDCGTAFPYLNKNIAIPSEAALNRPLVILALIAAAALVLGFMVFGGANMGN